MVIILEKMILLDMKIFMEGINSARGENESYI